MPSTAITVRSTITTRSPALETAAAVSSPLMADAMVRPERTSMMMKSTMIPKGVLIMPMIVPAALGIVQTPPPNTTMGELEAETKNPTGV